MYCLSIKLMDIPVPSEIGRLDARKMVASQAFTLKNVYRTRKNTKQMRESVYLPQFALRTVSPRPRGRGGTRPRQGAPRLRTADSETKTPSARWAGAARASGSLTPPLLHE